MIGDEVRKIFITICHHVLLEIETRLENLTFLSVHSWSWHEFFFLCLWVCYADIAAIWIWCQPWKTILLLQMVKANSCFFLVNFFNFSFTKDPLIFGGSFNVVIATNETTMTINGATYNSMREVFCIACGSILGLYYVCVYTLLESSSLLKKLSLRDLLFLIMVFHWHRKVQCQWRTMKEISTSIGDDI